MRSIGRSLTPAAPTSCRRSTSPPIEENVKPMGKLIYRVSTLYCMTTFLAHGGAGMGAAMGEPKARELAAASVHAFPQTPFRGRVRASSMS